MEIIFRQNEMDTVTQQLLQCAQGKRVFAFHGEMGAGKTTLIHGICSFLGVIDEPGSPTFSIINEYEDASGQSIYHMDLYRLQDAQEVIQAGVEDCLDSGSYCFVEWPEKAPSLFQDGAVHCYIKTIDANTRSIRILS